MIALPNPSVHSFQKVAVQCTLTFCPSPSLPSLLRKGPELKMSECVWAFHLYFVKLANSLFPLGISNCFHEKFNAENAKA